MAEFTDHLANKLLDHAFGKGARNYTSPANLYVALFTVMPADDGTGGTEVTGGSYARVAATFTAAASRSVENTAQVQFPKATASWGSVVGFGIYDASTGGNLLGKDVFASAKTVDTDEQPEFPAGDLTVTL